MKKLSFFCLISILFSTHIWSLDLVIKKETKIKNPTIEKTVLFADKMAFSEKDNIIILNLENPTQKIKIANANKELMYLGFINAETLYIAYADNTVEIWDITSAETALHDPFYINSRSVIKDIITSNNFLFVAYNNGIIKRFNNAVKNIVPDEFPGISYHSLVSRHHKIFEDFDIKSKIKELNINCQGNFQEVSIAVNNDGTLMTIILEKGQAPLLLDLSNGHFSSLHNVLKTKNMTKAIFQKDNAIVLSNPSINSPLVKINNGEKIIIANNVSLIDAVEDYYILKQGQSPLKVLHNEKDLIELINNKYKNILKPIFIKISQAGIMVICESYNNNQKLLIYDLATLTTLMSIKTNNCKDALLSDNGSHMIIQDDNGLTICELPGSHERELFLSKVKFLETNPTITEEKLAEILQLSFKSIEKIMGL